MKKTLLNSDILVLIPAWNEASTIRGVLDSLIEITKNVLIIDDGSDDDTRSLAENAGCSVISTQRRCGYSHAVLVGFRHALEHNYSTAVTIDADLAHDPAEIPRLVFSHFKSKVDLTIGDRFSETSQSHIPSSKRWSNFFAAHLVNLVAGTNLQDVACGFRAVSRSLMQLLLESSISEGYGLPYEAVFLTTEAGLKIGSCHVSVAYNAAELQCTKKDELLDLLSIVEERSSGNQAIQAVVRRIKSNVIGFRPLTIALPRVNLCLHPIEQKNCYIFQAQSEVFHLERKGELFNLDDLDNGLGNGR